MTARARRTPSTRNSPGPSDSRRVPGDIRDGREVWAEGRGRCHRPGARRWAAPARLSSSMTSADESGASTSTVSVARSEAFGYTPSEVCSWSTCDGAGEARGAHGGDADERRWRCRRRRRIAIPLPPHTWNSVCLLSVPVKQPRTRVLRRQRGQVSHRMLACESVRRRRLTSREVRTSPSVDVR